MAAVKTKIDNSLIDILNVEARLTVKGKGAAPWGYIDYLLFASDLLLLQQDNDVIRFRHILLRDYFAALTPDRIEALAERVES